MHKPAGYYCKNPSHCRSRLFASGGYCTKHCETDSDCPNGFYCRESKVYTNKLDLELAGEGTTSRAASSSISVSGEAPLGSLLALSRSAPLHFLRGQVFSVGGEVK